MNWDSQYLVSKSLLLQIHPEGKFVGTNSVSRTPQEIAQDAIPVMMCFAKPCTPKAALAKLKENWELEDDGFQIVVENLIAQNLLTPVQSANVDTENKTSLATGGFASLLSHHYMLKDNIRVMSYKSAISAHVKDKTVVEIGCGSGILSLFAAKAGAKKVIAIEESAIAELAKQMFQANGCDKTIELRLGNSRDIELKEKADVIVHEIIGVDPFMEKHPSLYRGRAESLPQRRRTDDSLQTRSLLSRTRSRRQALSRSGEISFRSEGVCRTLRAQLRSLYQNALCDEPANVSAAD